MGYQIWKSRQVEGWLSELRSRDPVAADRIDEAITTLRTGGDNVGPPLVVPLDDPASHRTDAATTSAGGLLAPVRKLWRGQSASHSSLQLLGKIGYLVALPGLDAAYRRERVKFTRVRRSVATVATSRMRLERQIRQLEQQTGELSDQAGLINRKDGLEQLANLRRQYADIQAKEQRLTLASLRLQTQMRVLLTSKEATQKAYKAAEDAAAAVQADVGSGANAEHGFSVADTTGSAEPDIALPGSTFRELRPDAPESTDIRIMFTVDPPGTAVLLAVGMESDWLEAGYDEIIALCRSRYQHERESAL